MLCILKKCDFTSISDFYKVNTASDNVIQTKIPEIPVTKAINKSSWRLSLWTGIMRADPGCAEHSGITDLPLTGIFPFVLVINANFIQLETTVTTVLMFIGRNSFHLVKNFKESSLKQRLFIQKGKQRQFHTMK